MATSTPWGPSQSSHQYAVGIVSYSTAGHGGIHLSPTRQTELQSKFPEFKNWLKNPAWWEEDADACVVILAFPDVFDGDLVRRVFGIVKLDKYFEPCRRSPYWIELEKKFAA